MVNELIGRRRFMGATAAATLSALFGREPRMLHAQAGRPNATADAFILLWMAGGMAQTETWDPKRYTPFESGVRTEDVLSTFPSIDTAVDNIKISQGLERVARVMDRGAIIRTFQHQISDTSCIHATSTTGIRVRAAADRGDAAHRCRDLENPRAEESNRPGVHLDRPEHGNRR